MVPNQFFFLLSLAPETVTQTHIHSRLKKTHGFWLWGWRGLTNGVQLSDVIATVCSGRARGHDLQHTTHSINYRTWMNTWPVHRPELQLSHNIENEHADEMKLTTDVGDTQRSFSRHCEPWLTETQDRHTHHSVIMCYNTVSTPYAAPHMACSNGIVAPHPVWTICTVMTGSNSFYCLL